MKTYDFTYSAFTHELKEYSGEITLTADNDEQAYDKAHVTVLDKWGRDCTVILSMKKDGDAE